MENAKQHKHVVRTLQGVVVSDKMQKTIVVRVTRTVWHPKYHRQYQTSATYKVHDPENTFKVGDTVSFIADRPRSKGKRWRVLTPSSTSPTT